MLALNASTSGILLSRLGAVNIIALRRVDLYTGFLSWYGPLAE